MDQSFKAIGAIALAVVVCVSAPASADDVFALPWDRESFNSTYQQWSFESISPADDVAPSGTLFNPNGDPFADLTTGDTVPTVGAFAGRSTVLQLINDQNDPTNIQAAVFHVPTPAASDLELTGFIQVTWSGNFPGVIVPSGTGAFPIETVAASDPGWSVTTFAFAEFPSPAGITVAISAFPDQVTYIDQVIVDTLSAPTPAAGVSALGLLGLIAVRRRR